VGAAIAAGAAQTVTLTNNGLKPLAISTVLGVTGANAADFPTSGNTCGTSLGSNTSCSISVAFKPTAVGVRSATLRLVSNAGGVAGTTTSITLTGTGVANSAATGAPVVSDTTPQSLPVQPLGVNTAAIADLNGLGAFSFQWQRSASGNANTWTNVGAVDGGNTATLRLAIVGQRYRVQVRFTDAVGYSEGVSNCQTAAAAPCQLTSAATAPTTLGPNSTGVITQPSVRIAPAAVKVTPAPTTTVLPAAVSASAVSVAAGAALKVSATVPAGANTVSISVFRLGASSRSGRHAGKVHVATVYRTAHNAKRYVFRLTNKRLRHLKPGRYLIEVRVGSSRSRLGPAVFRTVTIKRAKR